MLLFGKLNENILINPPPLRHLEKRKVVRDAYFMAAIIHTRVHNWRGMYEVTRAC